MKAGNTNTIIYEQRRPSNDDSSLHVGSSVATFCNNSHFLSVGLGSQKSCESSPPLRIQVRIPRLDAHFTGTGDLFASLLTAWHHRHPKDLKIVLQKVLRCEDRDILVTKVMNNHLRFQN